MPGLYFWHFPRVPRLLMSVRGLREGQVKEAVVWRGKAGASGMLSFAACRRKGLIDDEAGIYI